MCTHVNNKLHSEGICAAIYKCTDCGQMLEWERPGMDPYFCPSDHAHERDAQLKSAQRMYPTPIAWNAHG